jgi:hypothetical protein
MKGVCINEYGKLELRDFPIMAEMNYLKGL